MANTIYDTDFIKLIDGRDIHISPLKIKFLRQFMDKFQNVKLSKNDEEALDCLVECATIAMKQYCPEIDTTQKLEDSVDLPTIYKILGIAGGININEDSKESVKDQAEESGQSWEDIDLASLEAEVFILGIWKNYEELEEQLSMPELIKTITQKREDEYRNKKFFAAMKGIDLDKESGKSSQDAWEKMKAKVFSNGKTSNPNDIVALQGANAQKAGFGIGMGLNYQDLTKK
jgi:hypothetical protein